MNTLEQLLEIYCRNYEALALHAIMVTHDAALAEDLMQDLAEKILRKPEVFLKAKTVLAYYKTSLSNAAKDHFKSQRRNVTMDAAEMENSAMWQSMSNADQDLALDIRRILENCTEQEKQLIELRYIYGYDIREIAKILGCKAGTVRQAIFRFRHKLGRALDNEKLALIMLLILAQQLS